MVLHPYGPILIWEIIALAKQLRLDPAQLTDVGRKREHNEDNMAYVIPKDHQVMAMKGALFIVADGMGGHAAGEVASEIAVDTVSNAYYMDDNEDVPTPLLQAIKRANLAIHQRAAENLLRSGMGTTCVAAVLRGNMAYIANVGDSRAYLVRGNLVKQITQDHSWVAEQVRAGLLTEEQARIHAQRNVITRCLGTQPDVEVDIFIEPLQENDCIILCTDGLSGLLSDEEVMRIVEQSVPQESVYHLVERANENGGPDNITAIVVRVQEVGVEPPGARSPVHVGGRVVGEENASAMSLLAGSTMPFTASNGDMRVSSSPLHLNNSGPLSYPDSITAPQPALSAKYRRSRLFIPTLFMIFLILVALAGGGVFYFQHSKQSQAVDQSLNNAQNFISNAQHETTSNPAQALINLSSAQSILNNLPKTQTLDGNQTSRLTSLRNMMVTQVQSAIGRYNASNNIATLPCASTTSSPIDLSAVTTTTTRTQPQNIVAVQYTKGTALFALSEDALGNYGSIYQINNQFGLDLSLSNSKTSSFIAIASGGSQLFALAQQMQNGTSHGYTLSMYTLNQTGKLNQPVTTTIDQKYTTGGYAPVPPLITAWGSNVYVLLSTNLQGRILKYAPDNKGHLLAAQPYDFSTSSTIVSMAAFANQLFLLTGGIIQSLPLTGAQVIQKSLLNNVSMKSPIPTPLPTDQSSFTSSTPVPTPTVTPVEPNSAPSPQLSVPTATTLSVGVVNGFSHLYVGDSNNHRVLDLEESPAGGTGTPAATSTSTATNTSAATSTPTGNIVTMQLDQQIFSPQLLNTVKGIAVDPLGTSVNILAQNPSQQNPSQLNLDVVSVKTGMQTGCANK